MPLLTPDAVTQICSHQKDDYYINSLRGLLNANASHIFGSGVLLKWSKELNILADIIYYFLTTAGSLQTLGEEYTNVIQVDSTHHRIPTLRSRIVMIILHTVFPYFTEKLLKHVQKQLLHNRFTFISMETQKKYLDVLPKVKSVIVTLHRLHLSIFYIRAVYYTLAKRAVGINYKKFFVNKPVPHDGFSLLGKFSMAHAILMLSVQLYSLYKELIQTSSNHSSSSRFKQQAIANQVVFEKHKCSLCLERREFSTTTPCGHLFCWTCIQEWAYMKPECPLCRQTLKPNQLVCLNNYD